MKWKIFVWLFASQLLLLQHQVTCDDDASTEDEVTVATEAVTQATVGGGGAVTKATVGGNGGIDSPTDSPNKPDEVDEVEELERQLKEEENNVIDDAEFSKREKDFTDIDGKVKGWIEVQQREKILSWTAVKAKGDGGDGGGDDKTDAPEDAATDAADSDADSTDAPARRRSGRRWRGGSRNEKKHHRRNRY